MKWPSVSKYKKIIFQHKCKLKLHDELAQKNYKSQYQNTNMTNSEKTNRIYFVTA